MFQKTERNVPPQTATKIEASENIDDFDRAFAQVVTPKPSTPHEGPKSLSENIMRDCIVFAT